MSTRVALFYTDKRLSSLEDEINRWFDERGDSIQVVDVFSTATPTTVIVFVLYRDQ